MSLKTVYFDLGNVFVFFSYPKMIAQLAACSSLSPTEIVELAFGRGGANLLHAYETGQIDTAQLYQIFRQKGRRPFTLAEFMEALSDIFVPNKELWPLIEELKGKGVRLILLSNTSECHFHRLYSDYPLLHLFDDKVLSYQVKAAKPSSEIFLKALSLAECAPEECFYTDDIPSYIAKAKKLGLPGEVFRTVPELRGQLERRFPD